jgi:hypothetical protein
MMQPAPDSCKAIVADSVVLLGKALRTEVLPACAPAAAYTATALLPLF